MLELERFAKGYKGEDSVLLLFSGGLDTSFLLHFFSNKFRWKVHTLFVDLGFNKTRIKKIEKKAYNLGSSSHFLIDAKEEFINNYCSFSILANSLYYGTHPLCSSLSRPLISKIAVNVSDKQNINKLMHGSTRQQNNFIRYGKSFHKLTKKKVLVPFEKNISRKAE